MNTHRCTECMPAFYSWCNWITSGRRASFLPSHPPPCSQIPLSCLRKLKNKTQIRVIESSSVSAHPQGDSNVLPSEGNVGISSQNKWFTSPIRVDWDSMVYCACVWPNFSYCRFDFLLCWPFLNVTSQMWTAAFFERIHILQVGIVLCILSSSPPLMRHLDSKTDALHPCRCYLGSFVYFYC